MALPALRPRIGQLFRAEAIRHAQEQEEVESELRPLSLRTFALLWVVLGVLVGATLVAAAHVPQYIPATTSRAGIHGLDSSTQVVLTVPAVTRPLFVPGQHVYLYTKGNQPALGVVVAAESSVTVMLQHPTRGVLQSASDAPARVLIEVQP